MFRVMSILIFSSGLLAVVFTATVTIKIEID